MDYNERFGLNQFFADLEALDQSGRLEAVYEKITAATKSTSAAAATQFQRTRIDCLAHQATNLLCLSRAQARAAAMGFVLHGNRTETARRIVRQMAAELEAMG